MNTWLRTGDRRRLDPRPLRVTVKGVTVYVREYQHQSEEAEAEWRVQDEKYGNKEERDSGSEKTATKKEVPGEALWRELREGTEPSA